MNKPFSGLDYKVFDEESSEFNELLYTLTLLVNCYRACAYHWYEGNVGKCERARRGIKEKKYVSKKLA
ncbi:hypothetical protein TE101_11490 [Alteromonas macleodii]|nr:hypothetical protein TE101_11490 [Alteromonas macleodii]